MYSLLFFDFINKKTEKFGYVQPAGFFDFIKRLKNSGMYSLLFLTS